MTPGTALE